MDAFSPPHIHVGDLVKLSDGRWARYKRLPSIDAHESPIVVAVELEEAQQRLMAEAADALVSYESRGIPVRMYLDQSPDGPGTESVYFAAA